MTATELRPNLRRLRKRLSEPIDALPLVYVRVIVGLAVFFWAASFLEDSKYEILFLQPRFLFKYEGFQWVERWPGNGIYWHFVVTQIAAVALAFGLFTRLAAGIGCFSISYVLLVERQIYVNHYYLLACICGLLVFLPAGRYLSIDARLFHRRPQRVIARWQLWLIRFQLGLPYLFGAIAKLNLDWIRGQPAESILRTRTRWADGSFADLPGAIELMTWGGLFYDLLVVPMLLWKPTRWFAVALSLFFHLTNAFILEIGVFPWFMLAMLPVFFPPHSLRRAGREWLGDTSPARVEADATLTRGGRWTSLGKGLAIAYVLIQLLLPLRPWIYPGDPNWTERGHRFAWRMMLRDKRALTHFLLVDETNGEYIVVPSTIVLTPNQALHADYDPELIRQTAVALRDLAREEFQVERCRVHALALVSLNGRRPRPVIHPDIDLGSVRRGWWQDDWVQRDPGEFLNPPFKIPPEQWWQELELPAPFQSLQGRTPSDLQAFLEQMGAKVRGETD